MAFASLIQLLVWNIESLVNKCYFGDKCESLVVDGGLHESLSATGEKYYLSGYDSLGRRSSSV